MDVCMLHMLLHMLLHTYIVKELVVEVRDSSFANCDFCTLINNTL